MTLQIRAAQVLVVRVPLWVAIEHAAAARRANTTVFILLESDEGRYGIGEALARDYVTGESPEGCARLLAAAAHRIVGRTVDDPRAFLSELDALSLSPAAACALELAVLDVWSRSAGAPIGAAMDGRVTTPARTLTFSAVYPLASGPKLMALHVFYRTLFGMTDLKVKGTGNTSTDLGYLTKIRRAYPYPVSVRVDLNGALDASSAAEYVRALLRAGVSWFEQPFPKDDWENHRRLQHSFGPDITLCGDESLCTVEDVRRAARERAFRAVNIRVAKHGGIRRSLDVYRAAVDGGLVAQLGSLVGETSVLAYAGLHFAALTGPLVHHEGCFGKFAIKHDLVRPSLTFSRGGRVSLAALPEAGLVPAIDLRALRSGALTVNRFAAA
ncbi:MAG: mandelate racemase/muconate lactonizing enzyme family protein [bacterium]